MTGGRTIRLLAAGSLRAALGEAAEAFAAAGGARVEGVFAASGLLRRRVEAGEPAAIFASADLGHPQALARRFGGDVRRFARNRMAAIAQPGLLPPGDPPRAEALLDLLLDPGVRLGTSTPGADPSGDYAFQVFARAEALRPGAGAALEAKAQMLTGSADSPKPKTARSVYAWVMERGVAEVFLTYETNIRIAIAETPALETASLPDALAVGADYGLLVLDPRPDVQAFADFLLARPGQDILAAYGFGSIL